LRLSAQEVLLKCLTLWQPWASLVIAGLKTIETRSWKTSYCGPLAIHAAKTFNGPCKALCEQSPFREALLKAGFENYRLLPLGSLLGSVFLDGCVETEILRPRFDQPPLPFGDPRYTQEELRFGDFRPGRYGWLLGNPRHRLVVPVPLRGMQGLFDISDDLLAPEPAERAPLSQALGVAGHSSPYPGTSPELT
jgi:hypothetical protein